MNKTTIADLDQRLKQLAQRMRKREAAHRKAMDGHAAEVRRLQAERHKALLELLVDVVDGVQVAFRTGGPLDDAYGTIKRVMRTRCLVEFDGREWSYPLSEIRISTAPQGFRFGVRTIERPADRRKEVVFPRAVLDAIENGALKERC